MYIDTSQEATGCSIFQVPNEESEDESLIGYYSSNMPPAAKSYSVSELEATGILICLSALKCLKNIYIQIFTDHSSLVYIMGAEREAPTMRLKKIAEKLSEYHFDIGYRKGSEMVICDSLSRSYYEDEDYSKIPPMALKSQKKQRKDKKSKNLQPDSQSLVVIRSTSTQSDSQTPAIQSNRNPTPSTSTQNTTGTRTGVTTRSKSTQNSDSQTQTVPSHPAADDCTPQPQPPASQTNDQSSQIKTNLGQN